MVDPFEKFIAAARSSLAQLDDALVRLERAPQDRDALTRIYRKVHALQTGCATLDLPRLQGITRAAEAVLTQLRDGLLIPSAAMTLALLGARDRVRELVEQVAAIGAEPAGNDRAVLAALRALAAPAPTLRTADEPRMMSVPAGLLDEIMALTGDLILVRNDLLGQEKAGTVRSNPAFRRLSRITNSMQDRVMKTRLQPIRVAWTAMPDLLRQLETEFGKRAELVVRGADTELGRQVMDAIAEPLAQLVRNGMQYGLEFPQERAQLGKLETGRITLRARHEGTHVLLEVADNGCGIDLDQVRRMALAHGVVTEAMLAGMPDGDVCQLIFHDGMSAQNDRLHDVARRIEAVGGTISVRSTSGVGTSFLMRVPPSLSLFSITVVTAGGQLFGIPRGNVVQVLPVADLGAEDSAAKIAWSADSAPERVPVLHLGGHILPMAALADLLRLPGGETPGPDSQIIVVGSGISRIALLVNQVLGKEEKVVRPPHPRRITLQVGDTILEDGRAVTLLEPQALVGGMNRQQPDIASRTGLLLFRIAGELETHAVPLAQLVRVEHVATDEIERMGDRWQTSHRGAAMPLISLSGAGPSGPVQTVLVFGDQQAMAGLMVDELVDIVHDTPRIEVGAQSGLLGRGRVGDQLTNVVDVSQLLKSAQIEEPPRPRDRGPRRVLVIEDSATWRHDLIATLTEAGYRVRSVDTAARALLLRGAGLPFDAIVCDVEMPDMSGEAFMGMVRDAQGDDAIWAGLPVIAITHRDDMPLPQLSQNGFTAVLAKPTGKTLIAALAACFTEAAGAASACPTVN